MKNTSLIIIAIIIEISFFSCNKIEFNEADINLDNPPTVWQVLKTENSDLLSNEIKSIKYQKSTGLMWVLSAKGLQSYKDGSFTNYSNFPHQNVEEIYWESDNILLFRTKNSYRRFDTNAKAVKSANELDWNKAKHKIDFTYRIDNSNDEQLFIVEDNGNTVAYNFKAMLMDKIEDAPSTLNFSEVKVEEILCDTTNLQIVENESDKETWNNLCGLDTDFLPNLICPYEIGDTVFLFEKEVLLSNGSIRSFNLNEYREMPIALKEATYDFNTVEMLNNIGFETLNWGNISCWVYPSNEVCSDNFNLNYSEAAVDKNKTIYLKFDDHLLTFKDEIFKAIPFNLTGYSFLLLDGDMYLANENSLLAIEGDNSINTVYSTDVDCWVLGNKELQGFTKIENELWIANCENIVRCDNNNCENKRVEHPDANFFELRSNAIEVVDKNEVWIGYQNNGFYITNWDE